MKSTSSLLNLPHDCETAMALVATLLRGDGLRLKRIFDLHSACASPSDPTCPHHGNPFCDCQLIVLWVYDRELPPVALIGHGSNGETEVCLDTLTEKQPSLELPGRIRQALQIGI